MENFLSIEQKQVIKFVYKNGERIENSQSRIEFLKKSLDNNIIPIFLKHNLPVNPVANQERLEKVSIGSINIEKIVLKADQTQCLKTKLRLNEVFGNKSAEKELESMEEHLKKVRRKIKDTKTNKVVRLKEKENSGESSSNLNQEEHEKEVREYQMFRQH